MNTPFYKIFVGDIELTDFVSSFDYEDCIKEDDLLKFNISWQKDFFDIEKLKVGKEIKFQFGYLGGMVSEVRLAIIKDIEYNYEKTTSISITALDIGNNMKKEQSSKVWQNKTASQIALEIAKKYGLKTDKIESTSFVYENLPQGNKTDFEFLTYLAQREKNGSFRFFIKDSRLHFSKLNLEQTNSLKFIFGKNIISFKPSLKDSQKDGSSTGVMATSFDPLSKTTQSFEANAKTSKENTLLGNHANSPNDKKEENKVIKYDGYSRVKK